jgi:hypothetical protein
MPRFRNIEANIGLIHQKMDEALRRLSSYSERLRYLEMTTWRIAGATGVNPAPPPPAEDDV